MWFFPFFLTSCISFFYCFSLLFNCRCVFSLRGPLRKDKQLVEMINPGGFVGKHGGLATCRYVFFQKHFEKAGPSCFVVGEQRKTG